MHYPVFPSVVAAITSRSFHDGLGWLDDVDGHHLGLVLLTPWRCGCSAAGPFACLAPRRGSRRTVALALYPSGVGHAFNNPKDLAERDVVRPRPAAAGAGAVENRGAARCWAALYLGLSLSCKLNGVFTVAAIAVWIPIAYLMLYRRRQSPRRRGLVGAVIIPYVSGATFVLLWPWLTQGPGARGLLAAAWRVRGLHAVVRHQPADLVDDLPGSGRLLHDAARWS